MQLKRDDAILLLETINLGSPIAEQDDLLQSSRVETTAFTDLLSDKVDLVPGTKGSGKSALFRMFVDFLPTVLLQDRKVVIAHGVQKHGDSVFHAFKKQFEELSEDDFVNFWCIYLTSLAHEQFIKSPQYASYLLNAQDKIGQFKEACQRANIPEIKAKKSLKEILEWTLIVLKRWAPKLNYKLPEEAGVIELDLFGNIKEQTRQELEQTNLPRYVSEIKDALERVLQASNLKIWLMIDKLDEIFPRRTPLETKALRGLLRTTRLFSSETIRVKIFLRDDMLEQVVNTPDGFTALTHITSRKADTLQWSLDQILALIVKRIFANDDVVKTYKVNVDKLVRDRNYQEECFYKIFPRQVHSGKGQSDTLRWLYTHTMDGKDVVTARDALDLILIARQNQEYEYRHIVETDVDQLIGPRALQYGLKELSKTKRTTYLQAEFPHLWASIERFDGGRTEYSEDAMRELLGKNWESICKDLVSIGLIKKRVSKSKRKRISYWFPYLYRKGLNLTQGKA